MATTSFSPLSTFRHRSPITSTPNQFLSLYPTVKTNKVSAVHVSTTTATTTTMPSSDLPEAQAHPSLEIVGGATDSILPVLNATLTRNPYNPFPFFGWNRHVETIYASFFRTRPDVRLRRECLRTKDNGSVALDWVSGDDRQLPPDSPLLILLVRRLLTLVIVTLKTSCID